jgi:hypothetical protein
MFKTDIERVEIIREDQLFGKELILWIWYADKIPPHIGCSVEGSYFSLKASGKDVSIPVKKVSKIIQQKAIPFLLIQTDIDTSEKTILAQFNSYLNATSDGVTCLKPILELLKTPVEIKQIKDLMNYLESLDRIKHIFGVNLKNDYSGLQEYGQAEIMDRLRKLNDVKRKEYISKSR